MDVRAIPNDATKVYNVVYKVVVIAGFAFGKRYVTLMTHPLHFSVTRGH